MYTKAIENCRDNVIKLMHTGVVADCLISEGIFSPSKREDISSAGDSCACLLQMIADEDADCNFFSILYKTSAQLPAHGRLWGILSKGMF